ncbi:G-protein coupled receptor activity protein [Halocaridina rubra]|uniref:G-protein coupled receptor activity protein n=1 Tax=Halocaridina rubra TaxID=373956 RepID=A0AAN8WVY5_HALRR
MWGVKVCFSVRKAESFFDEATYISWAVYNIAIVNIVMVTFHLLIFPNAGPDIKYLLGFLRTQFSTSVTVLLIFGPKFYRIVKGTGDQYDNRARAKGVTASFSLNGLGVMNDEPADLYQENEELKEEIQKLAAQMEFMKIVHMEMNNRHLKPKPGGYFSERNSFMSSAQSPGAKNTSNTPSSTAATNHPSTPSAVVDSSGGGRGSGNENSSIRLSPAAELASERV